MQSISNPKTVSSIKFDIGGRIDTKGFASGVEINKKDIYSNGHFGDYLYSNGNGGSCMNNCRIVLGTQAGQNNTGSLQSVNIGYRAGYASLPLSSNSKGIDRTINSGSVSIGYEAGYEGQEEKSISIGYKSGNTKQSKDCISIGNNAGFSNQGISSIAIGTESGSTNQGNYCIAIGNRAGYIEQGDNSISIGNFDPINIKPQSQAQNSIILNGSGEYFNSSDSGFYVKPVRSSSIGKIMRYRQDTGEICWDESIGVGDIGCLGCVSCVKCGCVGKYNNEKNEDKNKDENKFKDNIFTGEGKIEEGMNNTIIYPFSFDSSSIELDNKEEIANKGNFSIHITPIGPPRDFNSMYYVSRLEGGKFTVWGNSGYFYWTVFRT